MTVRIINGDCREVLPTLDAGSVRCCVTSPPYWGLRDYGTARWEGGDSACDHVKATAASATSTLKNGAGSNNYERSIVVPYRDICGKCGARRIDSQIGLEPTPEAYVEQIVGVMREVRRVLADDGTLWLNLGDSYGSGKNLVGIPWRVAFALQADGWYLRQDIIWHKPNPMPESVTDRCTKAHEYLFLLAKSQRYYYDIEPIREPVSPNWKHGRGAPMPEMGNHRMTDGARGHQTQRIYDEPKGANRRSVWSITTQPYSGAHFAVMPAALVEPCILAGSQIGDTILDPFGGSGTVGEVAERLGRHSVLVELNPEYVGLAEQRTAQRGLFAQ